LETPSLLWNGCRLSITGVNLPEHDVDHPNPASAEVKESVEPYLY